MKAPDKIYVPSRFNLVDGLRVRESDSDVCYIRKDALLEWLEKEKTQCLTESVAQAYFQMFIDKIKSL